MTDFIKASQAITDNNENIFKVSAEITAEKKKNSEKENGENPKT